MSTGIVILNYNGARDTIACIKSIEEHNSSPIKYFIVDNGSPRENEVQVIEEFLVSAFPSQKEKWTLIANPFNEGYARGNNKGLHAAFADRDIQDILILNNDVCFVDDLLPALKSARKLLDRPGILTPVLYNPNGRIETPCARTFPSNWQVMLPFLLFKKDIFNILTKSSDSQKLLLTRPELLKEEAFRIGMPSGACMFIDKQLFQDLGGFDEGTFLYYEENILCKRIHEKGLLNYCIPTVRALHVGGASTSKAANLFLQKCNLESADYYLRHCASMSVSQHLAWFCIRALWQLKFTFKQLKK